MRFSCEHFPKVCQSCAPQKSLIPTLPANTEARILKEGWRSCSWQLARQCSGSVSSRALTALRSPNPLRRSSERSRRTLYNDAKMQLS
jgi:hypothetical protein